MAFQAVDQSDNDGSSARPQGSAESVFVDAHGRAAINFQVRMYIAIVISFLLLFALVSNLFLATIFVLHSLLPLSPLSWPPDTGRSALRLL